MKKKKKIMELINNHTENKFSKMYIAALSSVSEIICISQSVWHNYVILSATQLKSLHKLFLT